MKKTVDVWLTRDHSRAVHRMWIKKPVWLPKIGWGTPYPGLVYDNHWVRFDESWMLTDFGLRPLKGGPRSIVKLKVTVER